jgi:hypothetical protein
VQTFITGLGVPQKRKWPKLNRQALKNVGSSRAEFSEIQYCWVLVTFTAQEKSETRIANDIVYNSGRWCNPLNKPLYCRSAQRDHFDFSHGRNAAPL